jgi:3'-phosphoadenosine 5'-phosphosulfate sulfotransferase (PAPS reductase)/FAD synthetase
MIHTPETAEVIFVNHSGGKDSQAMLAYLVRLGLRSKIVIVHADLGEMEWEPMHDWIVANSFGCPVHVVRSDLDFFELCRKYKRLPSGQARFCTSELKTRPCEMFMKKYCQEHGITRAISALGIRRQESPSRAKKGEFVKRTKLLTVWNPILDMSLVDVMLEVSRVGQSLHKIYTQGYSRLSCAVCVFGRMAEHKQVAQDRPELVRKLAKLERELGKSIRLRQSQGVKYNKYLDEYLEI